MVHFDTCWALNSFIGNESVIKMLDIIRIIVPNCATIWCIIVRERIVLEVSRSLQQKESASTRPSQVFAKIVVKKPDIRSSCLHMEVFEAPMWMILLWIFTTYISTQYIFINSETSSNSFKNRSWIVWRDCTISAWRFLWQWHTLPNKNNSSGMLFANTHMRRAWAWKHVHTFLPCHQCWGTGVSVM